MSNALWPAGASAFPVVTAVGWIPHVSMPGTPGTPIQDGLVHLKTTLPAGFHDLLRDRLMNPSTRAGAWMQPDLRRHFYTPLGAANYTGFRAWNGTLLENHLLHDFVPYLDLTSDSVTFEPADLRVGDLLMPAWNNTARGQKLGEDPRNYTTVRLSRRYHIRQTDDLTGLHRYPLAPYEVRQRYREGMIGRGLDEKLAGIQCEVVFRNANGESLEAISADWNGIPSSLLRTSFTRDNEARVREVMAHLA